jgi:UDP-N-acetyl-D-mannosaminuronic acid dehydrogenase
MNMQICVIGLGYIGLPTAALLANRGYQVHGVDVVPHIVETINRGEIHIVEPGLDTFVRSAVTSKRLRADTRPKESDVFIIAVPTPIDPDCQPDIDYVIKATKSISGYVRPGNIVILESTSPVGTTHQMEAILTVAGVDTSKLAIAYCPERVLPGKIVKELIENDRIVGGINPESARRAAEFYRTFVEGKVLETTAKTAEMVKLIENSFRDVNIAFANELSILCEKFGLNVWEVIRLANRHPRVKILSPGCGVGGHCIAVDPWFVVASGGEDARLIKTARLRNKEKTEWCIHKIELAALEFKATHDREAKIACMGLAFKPDIDDLRESPALEIAEHLMGKKLNISAVEPNIHQLAGVPLVDYREAVKESDIVVFLVGHKEFASLAPLLAGKIVLDFCGVFSK